MTIQELMEKRAGIMAQARAIVDAADAEKRDLTDEEKRNFDQAFIDADKLREDIERRQKLEAVETELAQSANEPLHRAMQPGNAKLMDAEARKYEMFQRYFPAFVRNDTRGLGPEEKRALQQDLDVSGGYLVPPIQFVQDMIQAVDNLVFIRQWATKYQVISADALGAPSLDADPADPTWTSELLIGSEDSTMAFGQRELHPHPLAQYIKISRKLLRTVGNVQGLVQARLAYKQAVVQESAFLTGTGVNQPLGVFTASALGINTDRDVSTGNATGNPTFDGLMEAKYALKPQYWPRARWMFNPEGVKLIAKLKDGEGQYIWSESVRVGEPDRILGLPAFMSEYVPHVFTTGQYVGILGDWSQYWIADSLMTEFQILNELYAATNQVGIVSRSETDGMPVLAEGFVRIKLG